MGSCQADTSDAANLSLSGMLRHGTAEGDHPVQGLHERQLACKVCEVGGIQQLRRPADTARAQPSEVCFEASHQELLDVPSRCSHIIMYFYLENSKAKNLLFL